MQAVALYGGQTLGPVGRWFVTQVAERQALGDLARSRERHFRERGNQWQGQPLPQLQDMLRDDLAGDRFKTGRWLDFDIGLQPQLLAASGDCLEARQGLADK